MPGAKRPENDVGATGLAGGPGPTPPGVDDGTPHPTLGATPGREQSAEEQGDEASVAERTAGTHRDQIPGDQSEPAEGGDVHPDPQARREPGERDAPRSATGRRARGGGGKPKR